MPYYYKEELERILENDFLLNPHAFDRGRTNDDVVDSMLMCLATEREWTELFAKWVDNYTVEFKGDECIKHDIGAPTLYNCCIKQKEISRILKHYERVKAWIEKKGWLDEDWIKSTPEQDRINDIMSYAINY